MTALASFAFGPFLLLPGQQLLLDNREPVRIGRRALDLLTVLVRRHGELVSKEELLAEAWPGLRVEEGNLKVNIAALRRVLGEAAGPPRYIATVVGRGYRFVAPVRTPQAPGPARDILGRDEMIASVVRDLERARLVTIVGPGGVGKTRVAVAVAAALGGKLDDLTGEHHASRIPVAVESVRETSNEKNLLVLDGCEHLVGAVASHADHVLASTRTVTLLATSREPLCIRGERVRRLGALGLPPRSERLSACEALAFPAVQLFVERAIEACGTFGLDDTNATGVAEICHRLDGLPLAIERVAAHVGAWGVAGTLERIDRRSHLSECALTATVEASYALLSPDEQAILRRLSGFAGAFTLQAARAIGGDGPGPSEVVEGIAALVAKSLLSAESRSGEMHYRMTHLVRAYVLGETAPR